jgi:hypothetical protein
MLAQPRKIEKFHGTGLASAERLRRSRASSADTCARFACT